MPERLLGRHVRDLPLEEARLRFDDAPLDARDAEVDELHRPVVGDHHVVWRHVTMHDPERRPVEVGVRVREAGQRLRKDVDVHRQRDLVELVGAAQQRLVGLPLEVLHLEVVMPPVEPGLVGLDDVGVREARGEARLFEEHLDRARIGRQIGPQALDDLQLGEASLPARDRDVHDPHASTPELEEKSQGRRHTSSIAAHGLREQRRRPSDHGICRCIQPAPSGRRSRFFWEAVGSSVEPSPSQPRGVSDFTSRSMTVLRSSASK